MEKRLIILIFLIIAFIGFVDSSPQFSFYDSFESYDLGYNTIQPTWIPQYPSKVSIHENPPGKSIFIDSLSPYQGDRDVHTSFYKTFYPSKRKKLSFQLDFSTTSCNQTWKTTKGLSPQASTLYLYYNNPQDFISTEFKVYSNSTACGSGTAQISAFKRVNGTSTPLIPYTTYTFQMNKKYTSKLVLESLNYTHYKLSIFIDNLLIASSTNVSISDVKSGKLLLENGGSTTLFDNAYIKEYR